MALRHLIVSEIQSDQNNDGTMMVSLDYQLDWLWNQLRDAPLCWSMRAFWEELTKGR